MKTLDVVYVLVTGSSWDNNEIRFSIRSVPKNLPGIGRIIIIGEKPSGLKGFVHIAHPDEFPSINADGNIIRKVIPACQDPRLTDQFLFMNDDHIIIYIACRESTDSQIALNTYQKYFQNQNLKDMFLAYTLPYYLTGWKNFTRQINEAAHVYFNATNDGFIRDLPENTNFNFQRLATPDSRFDVMINSLADQFTDYYKHHIDKTIIYFRDRYGDSKYPNVNKSNSYNEQAIVRPGRNHRTVIQEVHKGMEPPQHARYTLISMNNTQVIQKEGKFPKNKKSEQSRTILPEMATHFSDSVDKRIWTKYGHLLAAQSVVIADALRIGVQPGRSVVGWLSRSTSIAATRYRLC
jgi:hypothetical protein